MKIHNKKPQIGELWRQWSIHDDFERIVLVVDMPKILNGYYYKVYLIISDHANDQYEDNPRYMRLHSDIDIPGEDPLWVWENMHK